VSHFPFLEERHFSCAAALCFSPYLSCRFLPDTTECRLAGFLFPLRTFCRHWWRASGLFAGLISSTLPLASTPLFLRALTGFFRNFENLTYNPAKPLKNWWYPPLMSVTLTPSTLLLSAFSSLLITWHPLLFLTRLANLFLATVFFSFLKFLDPSFHGSDWSQCQSLPRRFLRMVLYLPAFRPR